jgi:hypothetical protein
MRLCRDVAKERLIVTALNAALGWWRSAASFSEAMVNGQVAPILDFPSSGRGGPTLYGTFGFLAVALRAPMNLGYGTITTAPRCGRSSPAKPEQTRLSVFP